MKESIMRRRRLLLFFMIMCICAGLHAQVYQRKTLNSGESISDKSYYLFPSFINGTVKFKKGGSLVAKLNFNLLISVMQFINEKNDTLEISKPNEIDSIIIEGHSFFFNNGYYEVLASGDSVKLVVLRKSSCMPVKTGAMGLTDHIGAGNQTVTSLETYLGERKLTMSEDVEVTEEADYLLVNANGEMIKADKTGFKEFFPAKADDIQSYIKHHKIKFSKEEDIQKLFGYCVGK